MGANIKKSVCSVCSNEATTPDEFCDHIKKKGLTFEITSADGEKVRKKAYEDCIGIDFFEISFVFDPADETALISEKTGKTAKSDEIQIVDPLSTFIGKNLPMERVAALKKEAYPDATMFVEPVGADHGVPNADLNYIPQSDMITAPQEVNTLRNENLCPVCRASNMEIGRDGILECHTCGHVQEPEPLNNPDLSISQDNNLKQDNLPTEQEGLNISQDDSQEITFTPSTARKQETTEGVISEMFETILTTKSKEIVDKIIPVTKAAKKETTLGVRFPISARTYRELEDAGILDGISVEYPALQKKVKLTEVSPIANLFFAEKSAVKLKKKIQDVPVVVEAANEADLEKALAIIRAEPKVAASSKSNDKTTILPAGKKISDKPKDEKVLDDQLEPVEAAVTINIDSTEPTEAPQEEETVVAENEETPSVSEIVEEVEEVESDESAESDKEAKLLTAFRLADLSVELGLVEANNKMVLISELEDETVDALKARENTLLAVKNAGLTKKTAAKTGLKPLPRLSHNQGIRDTLSLEVMDEAIFL